MNIIRMAGIIRIVANHVLPKTPLPDAPLAPFNAAGRARFGGGDAARKMPLDQAPAKRIIGILRWQRPNTMQMIGQHHDGVEPERMSGLDALEGFAQAIDMIGQ